MCWNAEVSLNTFVFSVFVLLLVYYNNEYTKYKILGFDNKWVYIFLMSAYLIQLIEHFLWKNIKTKYNRFFTIAVVVLLFCQPIASLMLLTNHDLRNIIIIFYLLFAVPYTSYIILHNKLRSSISPGGHLNWNLDTPLYLVCAWVFLFLFSFMYEQSWPSLLFAFITFGIFIYKEISSSGSMWCWVINVLSIYFAAYLLFYLPFCENKSVC